MVSITVDDFDLGQIAESGQCFRMNYIGKGSYSIIAFDKYIEAAQLEITSYSHVRQKSMRNFGKITLTSVQIMQK